MIRPVAIPIFSTPEQLGSMVALLGYPLLIESRLRLPTQSVFWTAGYALLAALVALCAVLLWRSRRHAAAGGATPSEVAAAAETPPVRQRLRWIALAFVPSSLMRRHHSSSRIAAFPLLWVVPLAIYCSPSRVSPSAVVASSSVVTLLRS